METSEAASAVTAGRLELVTKAAVAFVATAYVIGLLVVNIRLQRYDVQALDMLRVEYILCGSMFIMLTAVGCLGGVLSHRLGLEATSLWRAGRRVSAACGAGLMLAAPFLLVGGAVWQLGNYRLYLNESGLWAAIVTVLLSSAATWNILFGTHIVVTGWRLGPDFRYTQMHSIFVDVSSFVVCLVLYAFAVYPRIEPVFGGGRPRYARVILMPDAPTELAKMLASSPAEQLVPILAETDEYLIVESQGQSRAVAIRKDMIVAIATQPSRGGPPN